MTMFSAIDNLIVETLDHLAEVKASVKQLEFYVLILTVLIFSLATLLFLLISFKICYVMRRRRSRSFEDFNHSPPSSSRLSPKTDQKPVASNQQQARFRAQIVTVPKYKRDELKAANGYARLNGHASCGMPLLSTAADTSIRDDCEKTSAPMDFGREHAVDHQTEHNFRKLEQPVPAISSATTIETKF